MVGIIGAMPEEIAMILSKMEEVEEINFGIRTFHSGLFQGQEVVVVIAGIGKVNAAITTTLLIENFDIDWIVNIGVAGGQNGVKHGDVVISESVCYHDVDVTKFSDYAIGQVPGLPPLFLADTSLLEQTEEALKKVNLEYKVGIIASGDQFIYSKDDVAKINQEHSGILAIEMEAAAIAHTASIYHIPFIIYRSISDVLGDENQSVDFEYFLNIAAQNAARVLEELLSNK